MKQHIVRTEKSVHHFQETENMSDIMPGATQVWGQADTITEFVEKLNIDSQWRPFGYCLRVIHRNKDSKNMTAHFYKLGQKYLTR